MIGDNMRDTTIMTRDIPVQEIYIQYQYKNPNKNIILTNNKSV